MDFETIKLKKINRIGTITLNRPKVLNAFNEQLVWDFQKATIDKLPIPEKYKKPVKKRYILGAIAAATLAGTGGFAYDTYSDYVDGDEETIDEIIAKLPENLKTEGMNELIGLGILKRLE